jgi:hypothetical protein
MIKVPILLLLLLASVNIFSQTTDQKIIAALGEEELNEMKVNNPGKYLFHKGMIEKGIFVFEAPLDKYLEFPILDSIPLKSKENLKISIDEFLNDYSNQNSFNALSYMFIAENENQYFRLSGTSKVLLIREQKEFYKN